MVLSTCQGQAFAAVCETAICGNQPVDDDTGCGSSQTARSCSPYGDVVCDGSADQEEAGCPETCESTTALSGASSCVPNTPVCGSQMDEGPGSTTCGDHTGNGFLGRLLGTNLPSWVLGVSGWALEFGAFGTPGGTPDNLVTFDGSSTIGFAGGVSIGCWINWGGPTGNPQMIIGKGNDWGLGITGSGKLSFHMGGGSSGSGCGLFGCGGGSFGFGGGSAWDVFGGLSASIPVGQWAHVGATFDGNTIKLTMDGAIVASIPFTGSLPFSPTDPITLGQWGPSFGNLYPFKGAIDGVEISDFPMSPTQLVNQVKGFNLPPASNLCKFSAQPPVSWLKFMESTGSQLLNAGVGGLNATLNGTFDWVKGRWCKAVNLSSASGNYLSLDGSAGIDFSTAFRRAVVQPGWTDGVRFLLGKDGGFRVGIDSAIPFFEVFDPALGDYVVRLARRCCYRTSGTTCLRCSTGR